VTRQIDVTLTGANDVAVISGAASGSVTEDVDVSAGLLVTGGTLTIADADANQSSFVAQTNVAGSGGYGAFSLDASGTWTYQANNDSAAIQDLNTGESLTDSFTAVSFDGFSSQVVSVTINGADDQSVALKGFESGTFAGWSLLGSGAVETQHGSYQPTEGNYLAALYGYGASAGQMESFLGLNAGKLNTLGNGNVTTGSALRTELTVEAGDVVHFDWAFLATDYLPFNDFSVAVFGNGQVLELADIASVGNFGTTGWRSFDYTATADMVLVIGVATTNVLDSIGSPQLLIDNLSIL
jgi:VCBS repeat-containing protein